MPASVPDITIDPAAANSTLAPHHASEPTSLSLSETLVERAHTHVRPTIEQALAGGLSDGPDGAAGVVTTASPEHIQGTDAPPHHPARQPTLDPTRLPPVIPPEHANRTLILCFDGTGDQFDADNSNVVQLVSLLKKDDRAKQMVYYQAGIGTYTSAKTATPMMTTVSKTLDTMFAWNLDAHVMGGYEFLMQNYIAGDRICIFGFSRGAYTARSLAGMIHKVGLLPADNHQQVPFAYKMYTRADSVGWEQSNAFKKAFSVDVDIEFVGVWDTVDSVGLIPRRLPFTTSNTIVKTFRHAISLDERRAKFKANLWNRPDRLECALGIHCGDHPSQSDLGAAVAAASANTNLSALHGAPGVADVKPGAGVERGRALHPESSLASGGSSTLSPPKHKRSVSESSEPKDEILLSKFEQMYAERAKKPTDVEEVWFSGCHCDVGGGSVSNATRHSLARIPLRWMVRECFKAKTGIMFHSKKLREIGLDPSTLYPYVTPRPSPLPLSPTARVATVSSQGPSLVDRVVSRFRTLVRRGKRRGGEDSGDPSSSSSSSSNNASGTASRESSFDGKKDSQELEDSDKLESAESIPLGTEEEEDLWDALSPKYDQLSISRAWWILEILPIAMRYQRGDDQWVSYVGVNLARPRFIPKQHANGVKVHRTVKMRMEAEYKQTKRYRPKAKFLVEPTWID